MPHAYPNWRCYLSISPLTQVPRPRDTLAHMGTPFTPAITLPSSLALLAPEARATPGPADKLQSAIYQRVLEYDPPGMWGANRYEQTSHYRGVVAIAAKAYLDAIGGAKFTLLERKSPTLTKSTMGTGHYSRDDEYEPVDEDHPLAQVLESPGGENGVWSLAQECAYLTLQHILTGDAPAWMPCNDAGKPVRFFALTSALVQPTIPAGADPRYPKGAYRVTPYSGAGFSMAGQTGMFAILPGEEVGRFRELHPWSRNLGMSRLESGAQEIDVLEAITTSRWAMFDHGLQLDTVALLPGADEATVLAMQKSVQQKAGGARNARRFLVVGGAGITDKWDLKTYGQSAREMDFQSSYDQSAGTSLAFFRVPKGVAGFTSQTSYAQHYAELTQFWDLGIIPYCRNLGVFLTQSMAKPWQERPGQYRIEVEAQKPKDVEMDEKEREFAAQNGFTTVNEYRKATNRKPYGPEGDVPLAIYMAKAQQAIAPPQQASPSVGPDKDKKPATFGATKPVAPAIPKPTNPDAAGSLPPRPVAKALDCAMSALDAAKGGALVPESAQPANRLRRKKKPARAIAAAVLKALEG